MRILSRPSLNFTARRGVVRPDMVVVHYTGMESTEGALARLTDSAAEVSAHWVVAEDGTVFALVDEEMRAWHAGRSGWGDVSDVNSHSIGIEIVNPGHGRYYRPFPEPQIATVERLLVDALTRWRIRPERVVGHACIAPGRKIDPGEKFDWARLARRGLSVWCDPVPTPGPSCDAADPARFRAAARTFGYPVDKEGGWDAALLDLWQVFVMRFRPGETGMDPHCAGVRHLEDLAARWPCATPGIHN